MQIGNLLLSFFLLVTTKVLASESSALSYLSGYGVTSVSDSAKATNLASALHSAKSSMNSNKDLKNAYSTIHSDVPSTVWASITTSGIEHIYTANPPAWFTALPGDTREEVLSEQYVVGSVITSVLKGNSAPATQTANAASEPTPGVALGGAAAAGVLGVVAML